METKTTYSDKFIAEHRYWNVEHDDWWEFWEEETAKAFAAVGISTPILHWSFDAYDRAEYCVIDKCYVNDWAKLFAELRRRYPDRFGENPLLPQMVDIARYAWGCDFTSWGNRYMYNDIDYLNIDLPDADDEAGCDFDDTAQSVFPEMGGLELDMLRACITANGWDEIGITNGIELLVKDMCEEAADRLQEEFDWLTSDECVVETLIANEVYEETEDEDED